MSNSFMTITKLMPEYQAMPAVDLFTRNDGSQQVIVNAGGVLFLDIAHAEHVRDELIRLLAGVSSDVVSTPQG